MNTKKLDKEFYIQPATAVAPALLRKYLCKRTEDGVIRLMITETECYFGSEDTACHAKRGITPGNKTLFEQGGVAYVYLCYGIYYLFNVVTGVKEHGEGVLIRGVEGAKGPGLVTRLLNIDKTFNGHDLCASDELWLEDNGITPNYTALPRVGINYADQRDRDRPWRYVIKYEKQQTKRHRGFKSDVFLFVVVIYNLIGTSVSPHRGTGELC